MTAVAKERELSVLSVIPALQPHHSEYRLGNVELVGARVRYRHDEEIFKRVFDKAQDLRLPLEKKNLHMERTTHEMIISAKYEQTIDFKITKYVYKFDHEERAPLF